jgi:hypothetical protein
MKRQPAWRVFATEFNDSTLEMQGDGEKTPSFIVSPLGAKMNRVFAVGVLTDVEMISEGGELVRAHLSDPTGVFTIYSGQYQPEATAALQKVDVPAFVALVGKTRTYTPEEGTMLVSLRPEVVHEVDADTRDQWILEACQQTKERYQYMMEARKMQTPSKHDLTQLGCSIDLAEGIQAALPHYQDPDIKRYLAVIKESLQYLQPRQTPFVEPEEEPYPPPEPPTEQPKKQPKKPPAEQKKTPPKTPAASTDEQDTEKIVLETIQSIEGDEGAAWDAIITACEKKKLSDIEVEEALTSLMDKGMVYEPVLGTIKTT